jgi:hypothetical protein
MFLSELLVKRKTPGSKTTRSADSRGCVVVTRVLMRMLEGVSRRAGAYGWLRVALFSPTIEWLGRLKLGRLSKVCYFYVNLNTFRCMDEEKEELSKIVGILGLIIAFVGVVFAGWSIYIARNQLLGQLQELNAKAKIKLKFHVPDQLVEVGSASTTPVDISVIPSNEGENNSSNWAAVLLFCKYVSVQKSDPSWREIDGYNFAFHSTKPVLREQAFFQPIIDSIGIFSVALPGKHYYSWPEKGQIPVAMYLTYGERAEQVDEVLIYDIASKTMTATTVEANNGKLESHGCVDAR